MQTLSKQSNVVPGAIALYAIPIYNISNIIGNQIYINDDSLVFRFDFANDSLIIDYASKSTDPGSINEYVIDGFIPGQSDSIDTQLALIKQFRLLIVYRESDGVFKFIGSRHTGLKCQSTYSSGNGTKRKGYDIEFSGSITPKVEPCSGVLDCKGLQIPL